MLIQPMMRILMKKVRTLRMELILNSKDSLGVEVTWWMILVLLKTAFISVTRQRTANPMALLVKMAPEKQMRTNRWWIMSMPGLLELRRMSRTSAKWTPREKRMRV